MLKKVTTGMLAVALFFALRTAGFAAGGFFETGGYTDTEPAYFLNTDLAVLVYNKEPDYDPDYTEVWTGSDLYIPIYREDTDTGEEAIATAKNIKEDTVQVSYKGITGGKYIENVSIVDGKKDKIKNMPAGSYVKVEFTDSFGSTSYTDVSVVILLSVNKVSYQESRVTLECELSNRLEYIDDNSVYGAQVPTRFKVRQFYNGEATFDMGDGIRYTGYVKADARYAINFSRDPNYDVDMMYPDATMQFYNFAGDNDTFNGLGRLVIPVDKKVMKDPVTGETRVYAYEILNNQQLRALGSDSASYDSKKSVLTINTKTLGSYVLSNIKLKQDVSGDDDQTFQSGYATDEEISALEVDASQAQSAASGTAGRASSAAASQVSVSTAPQTSDPPATGGTAAASRDVPYTGVLHINADNYSGENPTTGTPHAAGFAALSILSGLCLCLLRGRK